MPIACRRLPADAAIEKNMRGMNASERMSKKHIEDCVRDSLEGYFRDLRGTEPDGMYDMLVTSSKSRCSKSVHGARPTATSRRPPKWLGLNRNTLRKKLQAARDQADRGPRRGPTAIPTRSQPASCIITRAASPFPTRPASSNSRAALHALGVALLSTGGTAKLLRRRGLPVTEVADYTGFPEMLDGRVKTLHPKVHGGLLARRDVPEHMAALEQHGIATIDLLVVNLYPFEATVAKAGLHARGRDREHRHRRPGDGALRRPRTASDVARAHRSVATTPRCSPK